MAHNETDGDPTIQPFNTELKTVIKNTIEITDIFKKVLFLL